MVVVHLPHKFHKIYRETLAPESFLIKRDSATGVLL